VQGHGCAQIYYRGGFPNPALLVGNADSFGHTEPVCPPFFVVQAHKHGTWSSSSALSG